MDLRNPQGKSLTKDNPPEELVSSTKCVAYDHFLPCSGVQSDAPACFKIPDWMGSVTRKGPGCIKFMAQIETKFLSPWIRGKILQLHEPFHFSLTIHGMNYMQFILHMEGSLSEI